MIPARTLAAVPAAKKRPSRHSSWLPSPSECRLQTPPNRPSLRGCRLLHRNRALRQNRDRRERCSRRGVERNNHTQTKALIPLTSRRGFNSMIVKLGTKFYNRRHAKETHDYSGAWSARRPSARTQTQQTKAAAVGPARRPTQEARK